MGKTTCTYTPSVSRRFGRELVEKPSQLYLDIYNATKDREITKYLWALSKSPSFRQSVDNLEYDDMGEVTYTSLMNSLNISDIMEGLKTLENKKKEYGIKKGSKPVLFESYSDALDIVEQINSSEERFAATVQKSGNNYIVDLQYRNAETLAQAEQISFNNALNNELLDLIRELGFDVSIASDERFEGLFDPTNATFANGLIQAIKIAKGEEGEEAFPEEVSHLLLEGLLEHPLVQRLLNTIDDPTVREVLGEQYDQYVKEYNNDSSRLQKEAAGKLLADYIKHKGTVSPVAKPRQSLLSRIWNFIKSLLGKTSDDMLNTHNQNAKDAIAEIYKGITTKSLLNDFNLQTALDGDKLYMLQNEMNDLQKIAEKALTITARKLHLEKVRSPKDRYSPKSKERMEKLQKLEENEQHLKCIYVFLQDALSEMSTLNSEINKLVTESKTINLKNTSDLGVLKRFAKVLRRYEELRDGYTELITVLSTVNADDNMDILSLSEQDAIEVSKQAGKVLRLINELGGTYANLRYNCIYAFTRTLYSEDRAREIGSDRNEIMTLETILDHANRDLGFMDRWISAMSESDDALLTLIDKGVKQKKWERDQELIKLKAYISKLDEDLRKAGYTTEFMYEKDANGIPTGNIISEYDFESYNKEYKEYIEHLRAIGKKGPELHREIVRWKNKKVNGKPRLIPVFLNKEHEDDYNNNPETARYPEMVPNPEVYSKNADRINKLPKAQQEYYRAIMELKKQMMDKIPSRGQRLYRAIYISKSDIEGILTNNNGNIGKATLETVKKNFVRRADDLGFGEIDTVKDAISTVIEDEKKELTAKAEEIINIINDNLDNDEIVDIDVKRVVSILKKKNITTEKALEKILDIVDSANFYRIDTDFAGHRIQKLPIYYTRKLKDMSLLSTDFTGSMMAYTGMAVNYEKMDEIIDILELTRGFTKERAFREIEGNKDILTKFDVLGKTYKYLLSTEGKAGSIGGRIDDYFNSAVYEVRKKSEGTFDFLGNKVDMAKTIDTIKNYTGLLGLGLNVFSAMSNVLVGKLQQWIEAAGGEYFNYSDYGKGIKQYSSLLTGHLGEMSSHNKKNKLSLLIEKFDAMQDYYEKLRTSNYYKSTTARLMSQGEIGFVGMNAGEHLLHCQTMLAILNHVKLTDADGKNAISLFDALEVKKNDLGISELVLKEGLYYERDIIDKKTGKPIKDENGKIKTERVAFTEDNLFKIKNRIYKVNQSLNGAFSADDKGSIHRYALGRLAMQFRQWMPAHYYRRFARSHYDAELEQWREGYYVTLYKFNSNLIKSIRKNGLAVALNFSKMKEGLSRHEIANLRRAYSEIGLYAVLVTLCKLGGRIKQTDSVWAEKMIIYQLNRMRVECGASVPYYTFAKNMITLLQSPAAAIKTGETLVKLLSFGNMLDEVTTGPYAGWSEWERDAFRALPYSGQIKKAIDFDDGLLTFIQQ